MKRFRASPAPRLTGAVVAVAPVALVLIVDIVARARLDTPRAASAAVVLDPVEHTVRRQPPDARQRAAADFAAQAVIGPTGPSPFFYPARMTPPAAAEPAQTPVAPVAEPVAAPIPRFALTMIMAGREPIAMINGKPWRVGEEVAPGWTLSTLDARAGVATLSAADGRSTTVELVRNR